MLLAIQATGRLLFENARITVIGKDNKERERVTES